MRLAFLQADLRCLPVTVFDDIVDFIRGVVAVLNDVPERVFRGDTTVGTIFLGVVGKFNELAVDPFAVANADVSVGAGAAMGLFDDDP